MTTSNPQHRAARALFAATFALMLAASSFAQEKMEPKMEDKMMKHSKPTVAIIRADWCPACQKLGPTMTELVEQYKDRIDFVILDVTNEKTTAEAVETANKLGLGKFFDSNKKNTSTVAVFGEKSKVLFKTKYNFDRGAYVRAFDAAIAKAG